MDIKKNLEKILKGTAMLSLGLSLNYNLINGQDTLNDNEFGPKSRLEKYTDVKRVIYGIENGKVRKFSLVDSTRIYTTNKKEDKVYTVGNDTTKYKFRGDHCFKIIKDDSVEIFHTKERAIDFDIKDFNKDGILDFVVLDEKNPILSETMNLGEDKSSRLNTNSVLYLGLSNSDGFYEIRPMYEIPKNSIAKIALNEKGLLMLDEKTPVMSSPFMPGVYYALYNEDLLRRNENGEVVIRTVREDIESRSKELPSLDGESIIEETKIPDRKIEFNSKKEF